LHEVYGVPTQLAQGSLPSVASFLTEMVVHRKLSYEYRARKKTLGPSNLWNLFGSQDDHSYGLMVGSTTCFRNVDEGNGVFLMNVSPLLQLRTTINNGGGQKAVVQRN